MTKKLAIRPHPSDEDENKEYRVVAIFACAFVRVHTTERYGHMRASRRRNEKEKMKNREREKENVEGSETGWAARGGVGGGAGGRERERKGRRRKKRRQTKSVLLSYDSPCMCIEEHKHTGSTRESWRAYLHTMLSNINVHGRSNTSQTRPRQESYL